MKKTISLILSIFFFANIAQAQNLTIATASNFADTLHEIITLYQQSHPQSKITIAQGSTTNICNQIENGAPFDIFFSADILHADRLIKKNLALAEGSRIYAEGILVLWMPNQKIKNKIKNNGAEILQRGNFQHLVIAKPEVAPYGMAAQQVLDKLKLWDQLKNKLIYAQNIGESMSLTASHSVDAGFVAMSQILAWQKKNNLNLENEIWIIPQKFYQPIAQKVVIVKNENSASAKEFLDFFAEEKVVKLIQKSGYRVPQ